MENRAFGSFFHGLVNLIWPVFAYDIAELTSYIIWGYTWASNLPMQIMLILPVASDLIAIAIAMHRYFRKQNVLIMLGLIFDVGAIALYYVLRIVLDFSLGWY